MARSLVAIAGGLNRVGLPPMPGGHGDADPEAGSAEPACCMICGCPGGACALPAAALATERGATECPLLPRRVQRARAAVLRDPELLSLATASVIVIASVVLATF